MEASSGQGGVVTVTLTEAEAVTLHELIAFSEWSEDLLSIEVRDEAEGKVLSRLQMALRPLIPGLGTPEYGTVVASAWTTVRSQAE